MKVDRRTARYQDHPRGAQMCSKCSMYVEPNKCTKVEGWINPKGWSKYFDWKEKGK